MGYSTKRDRGQELQMNTIQYCGTVDCEVGIGRYVENALPLAPLAWLCMD